MSDNEKRRPNANYRLSREKPNNDEIIYHYNRERRLEKAPQSVRDLYRAKRPRFNLFKPLVDSGPKRMMLASIVILCVLIVTLSVLGIADPSYNLDGNKITIMAVRYEGTIILSVKKNIASSLFSRVNIPYSGAVNIAVSPLTDGELKPENIFYHRIFFTAETEENYSFAVPFDAGELGVVFQTEQETLKAAVKTTSALLSDTE